MTRLRTPQRLPPAEMSDQRSPASPTHHAMTADWSISTSTSLASSLSSAVVHTQSVVINPALRRRLEVETTSGARRVGVGLGIACECERGCLGMVSEAARGRESEDEDDSMRLPLGEQGATSGRSCARSLPCAWDRTSPERASEREPTMSELSEADADCPEPRRAPAAETVITASHIARRGERMTSVLRV